LKHKKAKVATIKDLLIQTAHLRAKQENASGTNIIPDISNLNLNSNRIKEEIGRQVLQFTNSFRGQNSLVPLQWDDDIWEISIVHSKNMASNKVTFGDEGFSERIKQLPYSCYGAYENVFMCKENSDDNPARSAVDGWIISDENRKNMLSNSTHCAVAVFKSERGEYFFTQIFVKK